ncbi:MAG: zeta toxin family protein [Bacteroidota bacterium]
MATNSRPLHTFELVEHFLVNALEIEINKKNYHIVPKIVTTELNIENFDLKQITLQSKAYRNIYHRQDQERLNLKKRIVGELLTKKRLMNDDDIRLGKGGAIPNGPNFKQDSNAYIVIGLPASGKSGISNQIADETQSIILDSDYAKRKLPEFDSLPFGASLVHGESNEIVFGEAKSDYDSVFDVAVKYKINIVIPKIGNNFDSIHQLIKLLKKFDYNVHITLVELDRKKATIRALNRFLKTKRYVPLALIFDSYSNNPSLTFYRAISEIPLEITSYGMISTDVKLGEKPIVKFYNNDNPAKIYKV